LNTCWKFHWVWMRSEKFLLNELDFYLEERGHGWETVNSTPFDLKTYSTGVIHCIEHMMKVSLSLDAIWRIFIKWAGLLLSKKKKKTGNFEITSFLLKTYSTGVPQWIKHLLKFSLSLVAIRRNFIKWAGLFLRRKRTWVEKGQFPSVWLENELNNSPTVNWTPAESFIEFGCDLIKFY